MHPETLEVYSSKSKDEVEHCYYFGSVQGKEPARVDAFDDSSALFENGEWLQATSSRAWR